jgi:Glyoxalase-like domain
LQTQTISRRHFLAAAGSALAAPRITWAADKAPFLLDHILLGCSDLERGIAFVEEQTGIHAAFGGVHPGAGTRNALLSLGENRYLEIIAPDPKQSSSEDSRDLRRLTVDPAIVGWAAHRADLDSFAARLKQQGFNVEGPIPGSRKRPDGRVLTWKVMRLREDPTKLLPFFIEWSANSIHPSVDSPQGCVLERFEARATDADTRAIWLQLKALDLSMPLAEGKYSLLRAVISGPKGQLEVTS